MHGPPLVSFIPRIEVNVTEPSDNGAVDFERHPKIDT